MKRAGSNVMTLCAAILLLGALSAVGAAALENGGFGEVRDGKLAGWDVRTQDAEVRPERIRGKWYHFICDVKPGRFDKIHLHLSFQAGGIGSIWWDNFRSEKLAIVNPDFEEVNENGGLVGWRQDNAGETIFSETEKVKSGKRSLRMTRKGGIAPTRVWQVIEVQREAEYRFEFDVFLSDDFDGRPNIATLTYESDGKYYGSPMWIRTANWTEILTERAGASDWVALVDLAGGKGELVQETSIEPDRNAMLSASVKTEGLEGVFRMVVEDLAGGTILGETQETTADSKWHQVSVPFRSQGGRVRVRLVGEGKGRVKVDSAELGAPMMLPPVQEVSWSDAKDNFPLDGKIVCTVEGTDGEALEGALAILGRDLEKACTSLEHAPAGETGPIDIRVGPGLGVDGKGPESYVLGVGRDGIRIRAEKDVGVLRATATLVQLLRRYAGADRAEVVACEIRDWPDMPVRGGFYLNNFGWEDFARYKFNLAYLSTSYWLEWQEHPDQIARLAAWFKDARKYGIRILASTGVFQGYIVYTYLDPNLAEGKFVPAEKLTLSGEEAVALAHPLVLRTKLRGLVIAGADGGTVYEEGKDYAVERGTPVTYPFRSIKDPMPDAIRRIASGSIGDGATVVASYNYAEPTTKMEVCLSEPEATRFLAERMKESFAKFPEMRDFNVNLDEIAYFRMCGLCKASAKTNDELLCDWIGAMDEGAKAVQPEARLWSWDDMLCPHVDAGQIGIKDPAKLLPKDMVLMSWGYNADFPQREGWPAVKYWSEHDLATVVVPWDDPVNIRAWAQVVAEARRRGWPCMGMIDSHWHDRNDYREAAICSWRIPREGEESWVKVDFGD
ncbi:MAG: glycoside hydrolase family 20 zincin-like fold domain-containing protein [Planctomycetota bacterium]